MVYFTKRNDLLFGKFKFFYRKRCKFCLIYFQVFWFDQEIRVLKEGTNKIHLRNLSRVLNLKFPNEFEREIWFKEIKKRIEKYKQNVQNKYESFANKKENCSVDFIIDAHDYFKRLYKFLMEAKESIYICGWWVSPELPLIRPYDKNNDLKENSTRLMDVLLHKARQGIQINILIYKEVSVAMTTDSSHTKFTFEKLHENIKVK